MAREASAEDDYFVASVERKVVLIIRKLLEHRT